MKILLLICAEAALEATEAILTASTGSADTVVLLANVEANEDH